MPAEPFRYFFIFTFDAAARMRRKRTLAGENVGTRLAVISAVDEDQLRYCSNYFRKPVARKGKCVP